MSIHLYSVTATKTRLDSQQEEEEKRRVPAVRAAQTSPSGCPRPSSLRPGHVTPPPSGAPVPARPWAVTGHPPALESRAKQQVRGAKHLSLCAKGVSRRLYCRDPRGERAPATCQVPWRSILPTAEPDPHGPREPIHLQSGWWKGLAVHTGPKPPAEWGVRRGRKGSGRPY